MFDYRDTLIARRRTVSPKTTLNELMHMSSSFRLKNDVQLNKGIGISFQDV